MISLTRLNGERIAVNPDLLERAEETPDTVLTLTNGTKYVVHETLDELIQRVQAYRAGTWVLAQRWAEEPDAVSHARLHLVSTATDSARAAAAEPELMPDAAVPRQDDAPEVPPRSGPDTRAGTES